MGGRSPLPLSDGPPVGGATTPARGQQALIRRALLILGMYAFWLSLAAPTTIWAQCGPQCQAVCQGGSGGGCPGGGSGVQGAPNPGWQLIGKLLHPGGSGEINPSEQRAFALNNQGLAAHNAGNDAAAERDFRQALAYTPNDAVITRNLAGAQYHEGLNAFNNGDYALALSFFQQVLAKLSPSDPGYASVSGSIQSAQKQLQALAAEKVRSQSVSQNLDRLGAPAQAQRPVQTVSGLQFIGDDNTGHTTVGAFGSRNSKPNSSDLKPATSSAQPVQADSAVEQLSSVEKSDKKAANAATVADAKDTSGCGFDKGLCDKPDAIPFPRRGPQTPAGMDLTSHIPDDPRVRNDAEIQQGVAAFEHFERAKADDSGKLVALQKQIDGGGGDAMVLKAQKETLENDVKRQDDDQSKMVGKIKDKLVSIGLPWIETPTAPAAPGAQTATK